jgi:subtilase family serine protease
MSWGDDESFRQTSYNFHFTSSYGAVFFAATGDDGSGVLWPSASANVVAVGGTSLYVDDQGNLLSETGWSGSGGGLSSYEPRPDYQTLYGLTSYKRAVPDVAYDGNPNTGFAVCYNSGWKCVGGTSAGTPQWAAINALGRSAENDNFYARAKSANSSEYFRDILTGSNGYFAQAGYDYVTGLGSPLTVNFTDQTQTVTNTLTLCPPMAQPCSLQQTIPSHIRPRRFTDDYFRGKWQLTLTTDLGTDLLVEGTSTASTLTEKWVFNANGNSASGKNMTLYYYDLLAQATTYMAIGGTMLQVPSLSYVTAPATSGYQYAPQTVNLPLTQLTQTAWTQKGTTINVN